MRALVFLLSIVLAFLLFLKFYSDPVGEESHTPPSVAQGPEVSAAEPGVAEDGEQAPARFLEPPSSGRIGSQELADTSGLGAVPREANTEGQESMPDWLRGIELAPVRDDKELFLAAIVVHGTAQEVGLRAAAGPPVRGLLAEAFARAVAGDPRAALDKASQLTEGEITAREQGLLQAALEGKPNTTRPASAAAEGPMILAMEMGLLSRRAARQLEERAYRQAGRAYSDLLLAELDAPWPADHGTLARYTEGLDRAQKHHRWSRKGEWPSVEMKVQDGDNLVAIRKRYLERYPDAAALCTGLIQYTNQLPKNSVIHRGQTLRIPTDPVRTLVDLSARWCLYLLGDEVCGSWPVGIGRAGEETPVGEYMIGDKIENPSWTRIGQEIIPFGDPNNPLGTRWIGWLGGGFKTSFGFHGTGDPQSVGMASSDGCVRFLQADIERLFEVLPEDAQVLVRE